MNSNFMALCWKPKAFSIHEFSNSTTENNKSEFTLFIDQYLQNKDLLIKF